MKKLKMFTMGLLIFLMAMGMVSQAVCGSEEDWTKGVKPYLLTNSQLEVYKGFLDDPAPFFTNIEWYKKVIPPEVWARITWDEEEMKKAWAEAVGFKAPDEVGKIALEIKPGKYTYRDKGKYPFDKLMWKHMYDRFNPPGVGTPNHIGNFTEIEVVPTRQYYWSLPIAEAMIKNMGKTKLDNEGYIIPDSYISGYPFPRPSGEFKAQQILYNYSKRYIYGESYEYYVHSLEVTKKWKVDAVSAARSNCFKLKGRVCLPPYGWFDNRAKAQGEQETLLSRFISPRNIYGNIACQTIYIYPDKPDLFLMYISQLRRIRRMSGTDTQDPASGDSIYDDSGGFAQKMTAKRYPYTYRVIDEREFLVPYAHDGESYIDSKDKKYSYKLLKFERRPMYVIELIQQDPNYVYGRRILYFDKETLLPVHVENYDQKGQLYRTWDNLFAHIPPMGQFQISNGLLLDHIDVHSTWYTARGYPAVWLNRSHMNISAMIQAK